MDALTGDMTEFLCICRPVIKLPTTVEHIQQAVGQEFVDRERAKHVAGDAHKQAMHMP